MTKKSAPTMKDVARESGVSLGTVSKVINGIHVGEANRAKVEDAIQKLNYQINTYARGLKTSKTQTITLIIHSLTQPFYAFFAHEVEQQVYKHGRKLILCCSNGLPEKEIEYLSLASQSKTDGIIAFTYTDISKYIPENIPLIAFDRQFEDLAVPRIASDNYSGGVLAVEKLLEFGCRAPIFIGFHSPFPGEADKRFNGYMDTCKKNNIPPVYLNALDTEERYESIFRFMKQHEDEKNHTLDFDGVFANTDYHACVAIQVLNDLGYRVPDDVQIIGFDGIKKVYPSDEYLVSTILQPLPDLAQKCVSMLLNADTDTIPSLTLFPVSYQYGKTTVR